MNNLFLLLVSHCFAAGWDKAASWDLLGVCGGAWGESGAAVRLWRAGGSSIIAQMARERGTRKWQKTAPCGGGLGSAIMGGLAMGQGSLG